MAENIAEFKKYEEDGAYHWVKTHDVPFWRRGIRLLARYDLAARQIARHVPKPAKGLDVGCGDGFLIYRLSRRGYTAMGVDASKEGLGYAQKRLRAEGIDCVVKEATAYSLPCENESQDFVTMVEVIEHLEKPLVALQEVYRVLKRDGVFVCTTPQRTPTQAPDEVRDPYHVKEYIASELDDELRRVFGHVEVRGAYQRILDQLYRPSQKAGYTTEGIRLFFRLLAVVDINPYHYSSNPVKATDQLLISIARKP